MYAIVKTGGKQYRVEPGRWLLVERLAAEVDAEVELAPLLVVDGDELIDGAGLAQVTVKAKVLAHERGPKLRIVKFKPKRGYKRRTGHRQQLTRIEVVGIEGAGSGSGDAAKAAKPAKPAAKTTKPAAKAPKQPKPAAKAPKPAPAAAAAAAAAGPDSGSEASDGS
jgi:large subunit ribosomal protein L21